MSVTTTKESPAPINLSMKRKDKLKKNNSSESEKKRKREEDEEGHHNQSTKKRKSEKFTAETRPTFSHQNPNEESFTGWSISSRTTLPNPSIAEEEPAVGILQAEADGGEFADPEFSPSPNAQESSKAEFVEPADTADSAFAVSPSPSSPFHIQTSSLYLPLAPISQGYPLEGICAEHISPLILTYYPPFSGVLLSYSNPRLSEKPFGSDGDHTLLINLEDYAVSWAWVTAEFLLFKPSRGVVLEGYVNLQNEGHLGVVCWNLFNASIERQRLPKDWRWINPEASKKTNKKGEVPMVEELGFFFDGEGNKVEGKVEFRVRDFESSHDRERGFLSIEGTLLSDREEAQLHDQTNMSRGAAGRRLGGAKSLGATSFGVEVEKDDNMLGSKRNRRS